ncbi:MAG TPA: XrtA/PEP-CTERM system histidine kinase PrsK [Nitrospirota bacterium]|nr:XrtA/PEP-CTERM system histidine kinase PrsK [Nitrospirota bacterium]
MYYDPGHIFLILSVLGAVLTLGVGILVFIRNPRHPANIGFGLGMLSLTIIEAGNVTVFISDGLIWGLYGKRIALVGQALLAPGWFLFSLTFIRSNYKDLLSRWKYVVAGLYLCAGFFLLWINSHSLLNLPYNDVYTIFPLGEVGKYFYMYLLFGILLCLVQLENTLRFSLGSKRRDAKYVIIGVGSVLAYHIYLSSHAILFSFLDSSNQSVTSIVILISCIITMFAVVRNKLLDVNIFVSRYVIYNSFTVLFVGAYLLIVGLVAQGIKMIDGTYYNFWSILFTFIAILCLVVAVLSSNLRSRLQLFIARNFYRSKYEFRDKWIETIEKIGLNNDLSQIEESVIEMISETMAVREVFLWLYEPVHHEYVLVTSTIGKVGQIRLKKDNPLILRIKSYSAPFYINETPIEHGDSKEFHELISPLLMATRAALCTPLKAGQGDLIGFILQGEDLSGKPYRKDDFDLLKAIASHVADRISNIHLTQELLASKEAEAFHHVSSFFIHDLKNFLSTLSLLSHNAEEHIGNPLFQQDALKTLKFIVSKMNGMVSDLTLLSRGIQINHAPMNINVVVEETLSALNGNVSGKVVKDLEEIPLINADGGQLNKVFLNLLLNAIEASPAGESDKKIMVHTYASNGNIILSVADQGCGMTQEFINTDLFKPFRSSKSNGLGIGLFQCKKIIDAHSGRMEVISEAGKGSEFRVILPK